MVALSKLFKKKDKGVVATTDGPRGTRKDEPQRHVELMGNPDPRSADLADRTDRFHQYNKLQDLSNHEPNGAQVLLPQPQPQTPQAMPRTARPTFSRPRTSAATKVLPWVEVVRSQEFETPDGIVGPYSSAYSSRPSSTHQGDTALLLRQRIQASHPYAYAADGTIPFSSLQVDTPRDTPTPATHGDDDGTPPQAPSSGVLSRGAGNQHNGGQAFHPGAHLPQEAKLVRDPNTRISSSRASKESLSLSRVKKSGKVADTTKDIPSRPSKSGSSTQLHEATAINIDMSMLTSNYSNDMNDNLLQTETQRLNEMERARAQALARLEAVANATANSGHSRPGQTTGKPAVKGTRLTMETEPTATSHNSFGHLRHENGHPVPVTSPSSTYPDLSQGGNPTRDTFGKPTKVSPDIVVNGDGGPTRARRYPSGKLGVVDTVGNDSQRSGRPFDSERCRLPTGNESPDESLVLPERSDPSGAHRAKKTNKRDRLRSTAKSHSRMMPVNHLGIQKHVGHHYSAPPAVHLRKRDFKAEESEASEPLGTVAEAGWDMSDCASQVYTPSNVPTTVTHVNHMVANSSFHDEILCQLLDAASISRVGDEAKKALMRAARARVLVLKDLKEHTEKLHEHPSSTPPLNIRKRNKIVQKTESLPSTRIASEPTAVMNHHDEVMDRLSRLEACVAALGQAGVNVRTHEGQDPVGVDMEADLGLINEMARSAALPPLSAPMFPARTPFLSQVSGHAVESVCASVHTFPHGSDTPSAQTRPWRETDTHDTSRSYKRPTEVVGSETLLPGQYSKGASNGVQPKAKELETYHAHGLNLSNNDSAESSQYGRKPWTQFQRDVPQHDFQSVATKEELPPLTYHQRITSDSVVGLAPSTIVKRAQKARQQHTLTSESPPVTTFTLQSTKGGSKLGSEALLEVKGSEPWDLVTKKLYAWVKSWDDESFSYALTRIATGHEVDAFPLSVYAMLAFKRNMKRLMTSEPPLVCDKLLVPPNMSELVDRAIHRGSLNEAGSILLGLWSPVSPMTCPRVVISLTRHDPKSPWLANRYDLHSGRVVTYLVNHDLSQLKVGDYPLRWGPAFRLAWPNCEIAAMNTRDHVTKVVPTLPSHRLHNSLRAAVIARNLLLGIKPAHEQDLVALRNNIKTELERLLYKKQKSRNVTAV